MTYAVDLFDRATVEVLVERFVRVLGALVEAPDVPVDAVPVLGEAERRQVLVEWNDTATRVPDVTLAGLFAAQVLRTPDATALVCGDTSVTYRELDARADCLARVLVRRGVGPESLVAVVMERSVDLVVGLLAVVKAGGAFVPVGRSASSPAARSRPTRPACLCCAWARRRIACACRC